MEYWSPGWSSASKAERLPWRNHSRSLVNQVFWALQLTGWWWSPSFTTHEESSENYWKALPERLTRRKWALLWRGASRISRACTVLRPGQPHCVNWNREYARTSRNAEHAKHDLGRTSVCWGICPNQIISTDISTNHFTTWWVSCFSTFDNVDYVHFLFGLVCRE